MEYVDTRSTVESEKILRSLLLPRLIEERMLHLIRQGRLSKWFSGYGQEAISVGCALALEESDYILPMHRNLGVWTTRNVELLPLFCQLFGKEGGFTKGRDRTFHFGLPEKRIIGMISHLGAMLPVACGLGLAAQLKGERFVVLAFIGEGATREGDFHEAVNLASVWKLPVVFVIENNQYGLSTPVREAIPVENVADAAAGYGIPGEIVDGNDVLSVIDAVKHAADHARSGKGPVLLEMKTFRIRGHEEASGTKYVPVELIEQWQHKDPVQKFLEHIDETVKVLAERVVEIRSELEQIIRETSEEALDQPEVTSSPEIERADVFALPQGGLRDPEGPVSEIRFVDAVREALHLAMRSDERVVLLGQDIAEYGGVFKATQGLVEQFGKSRVRNTPIIESGAVGCAIGLALEGFKPVVEMQYADFVSCAFNQVVNNLATTFYRWGAPLNVTIRLPYGGNIGAGPFHSQSMEAWFCHVPGLKILVPATPEDAKGLLLSAIEDPNPVLFFEHKYLYRSFRGTVPDAYFNAPIGKARIARKGTDLTILTYGLGVMWALEEAANREKEGIDVEVVDLRTLIPWDKDTVLNSLKKTNRLLILHEAAKTGGFGGELASEIVETAFDYLDAPPIRVGAEDTPIPFVRSLEQNIYSAGAKLHAAVEKLLLF